MTAVPFEEQLRLWLQTARTSSSYDWRGGCTYLGDVPADYVKEITGGAADWKFPFLTL